MCEVLAAVRCREYDRVESAAGLAFGVGRGSCSVNFGPFRWSLDIRISGVQRFTIRNPGVSDFG